MGSMYAAILFIGIQNAASVQPAMSVERTIFYRERAAPMYSAMPNAIAQVLIEIPYIFVKAFVYGIIVYAMIGFEWTIAKFFWYLFFMFFTLLYFTSYGIQFCWMPLHKPIGLNPGLSMSIWWRRYYWICPVSGTSYGLVVSQFRDITYMFEDGNNETMEQYLRNYFDFRQDYLELVAV
ncbi:hypothetical protein Gotur_015336 [Gossypium turneri]